MPGAGVAMLGAHNTPAPRTQTWLQLLAGLPAAGPWLCHGCCGGSSSLWLLAASILVVLGAHLHRPAAAGMLCSRLGR